MVDNLWVKVYDWLIKKGDYMKFNEKLIELRKKAGLSQEELGYSLNVSRQTVSKWELGETTPEMSKLAAMSELFGVTIDSLVKDSDTTERIRNTYGGFEYKSRAQIDGTPVIHINIGRGLKKAKGVIAIGNVATGVVAIGGAAFGVVAVGGMGVGIVTLGGFALGVLALGGLSLGYIALGGVALGYMAIGGVAFGQNALGGVAIAKDIAVGGYAKGTVAVGDDVHGMAAFSRLNVTQLSFRQVLETYLPDVKAWIVRLFERALF